MRAWRRPLLATVAQAQALEERRFIIADEPRVPELRQLTRSMNSVVRRLQAVFEQQAATLEELRVQAQTDAVTGLIAAAPFPDPPRQRTAQPRATVAPACCWYDCATWRR